MCQWDGRANKISTIVDLNRANSKAIVGKRVYIISTIVDRHKPMIIGMKDFIICDIS